MMGHVLTTRLQHGMGKEGFKNYHPGQAPPDDLDEETKADLLERGLLVDEAEYQPQPEWDPWAIERVETPGIHKNQGETPPQPGDEDTENWADDSFPNNPTTDNPPDPPGMAKSRTAAGRAGKADAARAARVAAADKAASVSAQAQTPDADTSADTDPATDNDNEQKGGDE